MANGKQYWLMVNSISLMNAEKSLKYTQNFVFFGQSKHSATLSSGSLEIQATLRAGA